MNHKKLLVLGFAFALALGLYPGVSQAACVVKLVAKNTNGDFIPNVRFEVFEQARDANNRLKPGKSLGSATSDKILGIASVTLTSSTSTYAIKAQSVVKDFTSFWYYQQSLTCNDSVATVEYLSAIKFVFRDGAGTLKRNVSFDLYTQKYDADDKPVKDKKDLVGNFNTGEVGEVTVYVPQGSVRSIDGKISDSYVVEVKNGASSSFVKYDLEVMDGAVTESEYVFSDLKLILKDAAGNLMPDKTGVDVYQQLKDVDNHYQLGTKLGTFSINAQGYGLFVYPAGTYVLVVKDKTDPKKLYRIWDLKIKEGARANKTVTLNAVDQYDTSLNSAVANRLKGYIVLQTESHGEAWYINPRDSKRYYLKNGAEAYKIMSQLGYGITNAGLNKIPAGFLTQVNYLDTDHDSLPDKIEESFSTTIDQPDSDGDTYSDGFEVRSGYNPLGAGKLPLDSKFAAQQKGKILLQVEKRGQAWYVDARDGRRYYMADGTSAYDVMRYLGLGITNDDLESISIGEL